MNVRASVASRPTILLAAGAALALSMLYLIMPVSATAPDPLHSVTICHRTNSVTNPYVVITVDEASVDGDNGNDKGQGDHLLEHLGPVWDANTTYPAPHNGDQWGDIIPPFYADGSTLTGYPTLNWNQAGMALFNNGCNFPGESAESTGESADESTGESADESTGESADESDEGSAEGSAEQTVEAGTGTPGASNPDTAGIFGSGSPLATILFSLILLASLASLAVVNVKGARSRS